MIKGFEEQTLKLSEYELEVVIPTLIKGFKTKVGKQNSITNSKICNALNHSLKVKVSEPRIRKCIFYLRKHNLVPRLIATSKGYWIATSLKELTDWEETLKGRIRAIEETLLYAKHQIGQWDNPNQQTHLFNNEQK